MDDPDTIIDSALSLPIDRRADLASRLLDSLAPERESTDAFSPDFAEEVQRRSAELDRDEVEAIRWETIRDAIDERLRRDDEA